MRCIGTVLRGVQLRPIVLQQAVGEQQRRCQRTPTMLLHLRFKQPRSHLQIFALVQ